MASPLISIITPTYNHARFLPRCIDSLIAQTYGNWELVIVDDGSTDNTPQIAERYLGPKIRYMRQVNRGVKALAATINEGLRRTSGELVTMFPSDDTWPVDRLERQLHVFEDPKVVLCFGRSLIIDENDNVVGASSQPPGGSALTNQPIGAALGAMLISNYIPQTTVLLRRSALEKIGGYLQPEGLLAEDYPTHMTLALEGEFRFIDAVLGHYRMHGAQMTRSHYAAMVKTDMPYVLEFFKSLPPDVQKIAGWTTDALAHALEQRLHNSYFDVGRRDLLAGKWRDARVHFASAFKRGEPKVKVKAALGFACSLLHCDLETVAGLTGHARLRSSDA